MTITLDAPQTVGTLLLGNSAAAGAGYTLSGTGGNSLIFDNAGMVATITLNGGSHAVNAPVVLNDNLTVGGSGSLAFGRAIANGTNGRLGITLTGGLLTLAGGNTYSGGTTIDGGTLNMAHPLAVQNSTVTIASGGGSCIRGGKH